MTPPRSALAALALVLLASAAHGQSVALSGVVGTRALLIVNGGSPKMVAPGETFQGVKVVSAQSDEAQIEIGGKRFTLRMGDSPVSIGSAIVAGQGTRIVLPMGSGGHFSASGLINGKPVQFVVDTGATVVAMGQSDATRLGINYAAGQQVRMMTANGPSLARVVQLDSIRINDVEVFGVQAVVLTESMPFVLLGNSFLSRFSMRRDSDQMVLERRY